MTLNFFVNLGCQTSNIMLQFGIKYSMHDLISDVIMRLCDVQCVAKKDCFAVCSAWNFEVKLYQRN